MKSAPEKRRPARPGAGATSRDDFFSLGPMETVFAVLPIGIAFLFDPKSDSVRVNAAFAKLADIDIPPSGGSSLFEMKIPIGRVYRNGRLAKRDELAIMQARTKGLAVVESEFDIRLRDGSMRRVVAYAAPLFGSDGSPLGAIGAYLDITDRKRYEDTLKFLAEASNLLSLSLDSRTTLESITRVCVPAFADWCSIDVLDEAGHFSSVAFFHSDPKKTAMAQRLRTRGYDDPTIIGPAKVVLSRQPELMADVDDDTLVRFARDEDTLKLLRSMDVHSVIVVPMIARDRALGAITFVTADSGRRYAQKDIPPARQLANRAALAYDNARRFERERHVADSLQRAFLPGDLPRVPGLTLDAFYQAGAIESEVGGDWYDAFALPDGRVGVSIGDVSGRGLRAAVAMSEVRLALRAAALEGHSPAVVLARTNRLLKLNPNAVMVTAIFGILDPATATFEYATAGHPPPLLALPNQEVTVLPHEGLPLVVRGDEAAAEWRILLPPGSLLVLYTDGLTEHKRAVVEGENEIIETVRRIAAHSSPTPARAIRDAVLVERPRDDVALLTAAMAPQPIDRLDMRFLAIPPSAPLVRQTLRTLATALRIPDDKLFAVQVAVGEALNNAIEHAYGVTPGAVRLRAWTSGSDLVVDVTDEGRWRPKRAAHDESRGRGLAIMRGLMDGIEIRAEESSTTVRMTIALDANRQS